MMVILHGLKYLIYGLLYDWLVPLILTDPSMYCPFFSSVLPLCSMLNLSLARPLTSFPYTYLDQDKTRGTNSYFMIYSVSVSSHAVLVYFSSNKCYCRNCYNDFTY